MGGLYGQNAGRDLNRRMANKTSGTSPIRLLPLVLHIPQPTPHNARGVTPRHTVQYTCRRDGSDEPGLGLNRRRVTEIWGYSHNVGVRFKP